MLQAAHQVLNQRLKPALLSALEGGDMEEAGRLLGMVAQIYDDLGVRICAYGVAPSWASSYALL